MIHLDTNFLIQSLVAGSKADQQVQLWIRSGEELGMSSIAWSEFLCGPLDADDALLAEAFLTAIEPFTDRDARAAADLFNASGRRSRTLADCQIAAVALRCLAPLATLNKNDFSMFRNLNIVSV